MKLSNLHLDHYFFVLYVCMHMNIRTLFTYRNIPNTYEYILQKVKITYSERTAVHLHALLSKNVCDCGSIR